MNNPFGKGEVARPVAAFGKKILNVLELSLKDVRARFPGLGNVLLGRAYCNA
jgi:hypothetical protein